MITGPQAHDACSLLRWTRFDLNRRTALPLWIVDRILSGLHDAEMSSADDTVLHDAFARAGVHFVDAPDGGRAPRLRGPLPGARAI